MPKQNIENPIEPEEILTEADHKQLDKEIKTVLRNVELERIAEIDLDILSDETLKPIIDRIEKYEI